MNASIHATCPRCNAHLTMAAALAAVDLSTRARQPEDLAPRMSPETLMIVELRDRLPWVCLVCGEDSEMPDFRADDDDDDAFHHFDVCLACPAITVDGVCPDCPPFNVRDALADSEVRMRHALEVMVEMLVSGDVDGALAHGREYLRG